MREHLGVVGIVGFFIMLGTQSCATISTGPQVRLPHHATHAEPQQVYVCALVPNKQGVDEFACGTLEDFERVYHSSGGSDNDPTIHL